MRIKGIERSGNRLRLIDQTKLPTQLQYLELDRYEDIIEAIKTLAVRGAPAIGIAAAYALPIAVAQAEEYSIDYLQRVASELKSVRPTAVNLSWAVDRMMASLMKTNPRTKEESLAILWDEADAIYNEDVEMCRRIGANGEGLIKDGDSILTHCNTGFLVAAGIGTALGVVYTCRDQGKKVYVYADETRPLLQGARLTAWELKQEGIDCTLLCDSAAGMLMRLGKIDHVIVGADRITKNGDVANKIGTYLLAVLAEKHGVPFYVAAPESTFDRSTETGDEIVIEERSATEVTHGFGAQTAPDGIKVYSPAFDITQRELISRYITDKGVMPGGRS